jgi:alpha-tubulin suppressor-like RCC1 family protein
MYVSRATRSLTALIVGTIGLTGCGHVGLDPQPDGSIAGEDGVPGETDGPGDDELPPDTSAPVPVTSIEAGDAFVCAVRGGAVWCWGDDRFGQLGDGGTTPQSRPVQVIGIDDATAVVAGESHACALRSDHSVWCWGNNDFGQLGSRDNIDQHAPLRIAGLGAATAITAGASHTCARLDDATVWCWGSNDQMQVGIDSSGADVSVPTPVMLDDVAEVAAGEQHTCARTTDGSVWCWGSNSDSQTSAVTAFPRAMPVQVRGVHATAIAVGGWSSCALMDGSAVCWGDDDAGRLGDGDDQDHPEPKQVLLPGPVAKLSSGSDHMCAVSNGNVLCWGDGEVGQLGDGVRNYSPTPVIASLDGTIAAITVGTEISCAVRTTGSVVCWGRGSTGQLGDGTIASRQPQRVALPESPAAAVAAGAVHSCAIAGAMNKVYCWGYDGDGELGDGNRDGRPKATPVFTGISNATQLALGWMHSCALLADKTVWCWGDGDVGELGNGELGDATPGQVIELPAASAIAAGDSASCAATTGGIFCWGTNGYGALGNSNAGQSAKPVHVDNTAPPVPALIAAGADHVCTASAGAATVGASCWGHGGFGQLGNRDNKDTFTPVPVFLGTANPWTPKQLTTGGGHTCAVDTTGRAWCWGSNDDGELGDGTFDARNSPKQIAVLGTTALDIVAGPRATCAQTTLGPRCWGNNQFGQLGDGTTSSRTAPTAVQGLDARARPVLGDDHACAVSGGEVYCWGDNVYGQLGLGSFSVASRPVDVVFPGDPPPAVLGRHEPAQTRAPVW